jgi:regulatory protein
VVGYESTSQPCLDAAFRYLSYRPRSELEIRMRLRKRGFDDFSIESILIKLKEQGLVDDSAFAQFWKENRESFSPRSRVMLHRELRQKGVASHIIAEVTKEIDEEAGAYRAGQKRAKRLASSDCDSFRRKLGSFLKQRGFNHEVTQHTVNQLWQERGD